MGYYHVSGPFGQFVEHVLYLFVWSLFDEESLEEYKSELGDKIFKQVVLFHEVAYAGELLGQDILVPERSNAVKDRILSPLNHYLQLNFVVIFLLHILLDVGELVEVLIENFFLSLPLTREVFFNPVVIIAVLILIEVFEKLVGVHNILLRIG